MGLRKNGKLIFAITYFGYKLLERPIPGILKEAFDAVVRKRI